MERENKLIIGGAALACVAIVAVIAYGLISAVMGTPNVETYEALIDEEAFTMESFALKLETSNYIGDILINDGDAIITSNNNEVKVSITMDELIYLNTFKLENGILKAALYNNLELDEITYNIYDVAYAYAYNDEENKVSEYIKNTNKSLYNLSNVGIALENDKISMIVNGKINFIDFRAIYMTSDEIIEYAERLKKDLLTKFSNENISVIRTGYDEYVVISIAEREKLTDASVQSLLNVLAVSLDYNDVYEDFVRSHLEFELKDEKTDWYNLEVDPKKELYEQDYFGDMPMIRIKIKNAQ